jgi:glycosyltransferase involved in cell wall biosynthesis
VTARRLVFVTQVVDADHGALAQTVDAVRALAERYERVDVICDHVGRHDLPADVGFRTFGSGTKAGRGARFELALAGTLRPRPDAVFVHMVPTFVALAAPLAKPARVPLLLWYTHWHASRALRLATRLADRVLSVDRRSFPFETDKLRGIGHAIDVERFVPHARPAASDGALRLLALGRFARWKGYATLLEGFRLAVEEGLDATLEVRGPELTDDERRHRAELAALVAATPALAERVRLEAPVVRDEIPALLAGADALVSATEPRGSETLDKVVYEAAACAVPVVSSNTALAEFLDGLPVELRFRARDPADLARALSGLAAAGGEARAQAGATLRLRVEQGHSLSSWADAVAASVAELGPVSRVHSTAA